MTTDAISGSNASFGINGSQQTFDSRDRISDKKKVAQQQIRLDADLTLAAKGSVLGGSAPVPNWSTDGLNFRFLGDIKAVVDQQQFDIQAVIAVLIRFAVNVQQATKNHRFNEAVNAANLKNAGADQLETSALLQGTGSWVKSTFEGIAGSVSIFGGVNALGYSKGAPPPYS